MSNIEKFKSKLKAGGIRFDSCERVLNEASRDASQLKIPPVCVVYPASGEEISNIVILCNKYAIPVTVSGGYTGLSGGVLGYKAVRIETKQLNSFSITGDSVTAEPGASIPEIMRRTAEKGFVFPFQPASACRSQDVYEYLGNRIGPVTIGGSLGANASGLVGCRLGAAADWTRKLTVVLPSGEIKAVTGNPERYIGTEGRYGIITEAEIKLAPFPENIKTFLVSGTGINSFTTAAVSIGKSGVFPFLAEGIVQSENPPDLKGLAQRTFEDPEPFLEKFGSLFAPDRWLILLQGSPDELERCLNAIAGPGIENQELSDAEFMQIKQIRSLASDEIGTGIENPNTGSTDIPPVKRAAAFIAEAIQEFSSRGIRPKAEHNYGALWVFLAHETTRENYKNDIAKQQAFDDGSLTLYDECRGDITRFLERYLSPRITEDMIRTKTAVNFPGNEDILIQAEQFPETIELLNTLMQKYRACPVPLYYCHINFRKNPGWILLHNRLLIDVREFI